MNFTQQCIRGFPADTRIRNRHAVFHFTARLLGGLVAFVNITFNHQANNGTVAVFDLRDHRLCHGRLATVIFIRVTMAAIYHQRRAESCLFHLFFTLRDICRAVVWRFPTAQNDMAIRVALRLQQSDLPRLVDTDKNGVTEQRHAWR
ncbi:Uncharacterised protein [Citrobacter koseri]|nr:Uncharacterised protein [Citrobacter koseri]